MYGDDVFRRLSACHNVPRLRAREQAAEALISISETTLQT